LFFFFFPGELSVFLFSPEKIVGSFPVPSLFFRGPTRKDRSMAISLFLKEFLRVQRTISVATRSLFLSLFKYALPLPFFAIKICVISGR